ncbi:uncharacterized protein BO97DRAFT_449269 [Aspergillus homomorphus CBS 101889]|uniref:Uncharacterized protein n=1 Tax=Aspergillus homomorphus (strain CBS 101889) TaxID=1450537 RepID=A0A395I116_ASPHC|nr:hypothetical protein BO97DRAFT_449269 [Aspergillus homomorphus CBS 101889]RAL13881.1 hypothetical protein BO97DRAFT_449269 [Aspergillus homomorphus CBS 101889]
MRFLKASILTLNAFSGATLAVPSTPPSSTDGQLIEGQRQPDVWYSSNLDDSETFQAILEAAAVASDVNSTSTLAAREPIKVCESDLSRMAQCAMISSYVSTITSG